MDFHDFPRFLGKSGKLSHHPPKLCARLALTTILCLSISASPILGRETAPDGAPPDIGRMACCLATAVQLCVQDSVDLRCRGLVATMLGRQRRLRQGHMDLQ